MRALVLVASAALAFSAAVLAANSPAPVSAPPPATQGPGQAAAPPATGAVVHLKTGVCNQKSSVTLKVGGAGLVIIADGTPGGPEYHFPTAIWTGILYASNWMLIRPQVAGMHYTLTFASSDCPASDGLYVANATTISLTVT